MEKQIRAEGTIKMDKNNLETIKITVEDESLRLDAFLMQKLPGYSRSYFQKIIVKKLVWVNGEPVNKSYTVRRGDEITVTFPKPTPITGVAQDVPFGVIDTQKDFLIVNKPAGLLVHYTKSAPLHAEQATPTLVNGLLYRFKEFAEFDDQERPGIVHRLDKDTSGLIIVARNPQAHAELSELFRKREVGKEYLAVVKGHPEPTGTIDLPVGRHPTERTKMSHVSYAGKPALTRYRVLKYFKKGVRHPECSLVNVELVTGRTHQIRVHFAAIGHGLLGDSVYGVRSKLIDRQALHSWKTSFIFRGKQFSYEAPLPEDLKLMLEELEKSGSMLTEW